MKDFRELKVWKKSHSLTLKIYEVTSMFPKEELYGLTSQIRRSCISIPTNIAEGCGRGSDADMGRFFQISLGSSSELEYLLLLSHDLNILKKSDYDDLNSEVVEIKKMTTKFIKKLKAES